MKVAICISGQCRSRGGHELLISQFKRLNPDYFLHTWHEPPFSYWAIDNFQPKAYAADQPERFRALKQSFFDSYDNWQPDKAIVSDRVSILHGEKFLDKEKSMPSAYDGALRMFYSMTQASKLAQAYDNYDYVIKVRPDTRLLKGFPVDFKALEPRCIEVDRHHFFGGLDEAGKALPMSDQCFWGGHEVMYSVMNIWNRLPAFLAMEDEKHPIGEITSWLHPETTLRRFAVQECAATIVPVSHVRVHVHREGAPGDPVGSWRVRPHPPQVRIRYRRYGV